ncbi:Inositolphosphorylceramide synthase subunit Kei1-domain-containing protein [Mycena rebaudengoi]|nr:Inositolphosphorylceramide synthase subunit Kei1-domain-containing protein [Mycena rebaudengoi]
MLRHEWRLWPFTSFLAILDLKTGVTIALLFALLNKVAGVYGLIAALTGAGGSFAQLSLYIYSVGGIVAFFWGLKVVEAEDVRKTLYFAHLFSADYILSTAWTVFFGVEWFFHNPHDGARQANSPAQEDIVRVAHITGTPMTDQERAAVAQQIWNAEKSMAFLVIVVSWLSKIYFALLIYSYATHLRKGSYRALARTTHAAPTMATALDLPDEEDEEIEDFYRVPLHQPPTPNKHVGNHLNNITPVPSSSFADKQKRASSSTASRNPAKAPPADDADEEPLFDDDYPYISSSSGSTSKAHSKHGTESSPSRSASSDNEADAPTPRRNTRSSTKGVI